METEGTPQSAQPALKKPGSFVDNGGKGFELCCTIVGDPWSGKTAFVENLLFGSKAGTYYPSTLDLYVATGVIDVLTTEMQSFRKTKRFKLWMTDTSGMSFHFRHLIAHSVVLGDGQFDMLRQLAYKNPSLVLVTLDVTSEYSINSVEERVRKNGIVAVFGANIV